MYIFSYKIKIENQLGLEDHAQKVAISFWSFTSDRFSNELVLGASGLSNTHNTRIEGTYNPRVTPQH